MKDVVRIGVHHATPVTAWCVNGGFDVTDETVLTLFDVEGSYRYAGSLALSPALCAPDRTLRIAWAETQVFDKPWREGERATRPGDIFAIGQSLYLVTRQGFGALTHAREPRVVDAEWAPYHKARIAVPTVCVTFDNGEMDELLWQGHQYDGRDVIGRTRAEVRDLMVAWARPPLGSYGNDGIEQAKRREHEEATEVC